MKDFREVKYISIPKGLPNAIINDNKLFKAIVMYYKLKSLYKSGVIKQYTKRYSEIAKHPNVNCSESKLRMYISILKEYGFVYKDKSKNLHIVSKTKLKDKFNISKYSYKIEKKEICNLEYYLKGILLENNLEQQKSKLIEKIVFDKYNIGKAKGCKNDKLFKKLKKGVIKNLDENLKYYQYRYIRNIKNNLFNSLNNDLFPFITLSRKGVAKVMNRKSKSSGNYLINNLKKLNLIDKDESNNIILEKRIDYKTYLKYRDYYFNLLINNNIIKSNHIKYSKGNILYCLPNNISLTLCSRF